MREKNALHLVVFEPMASRFVGRLSNRSAITKKPTRSSNLIISSSDLLECQPSGVFFFTSETGFRSPYFQSNIKAFALSFNGGALAKLR